jgi:hypothetical protein
MGLADSPICPICCGEEETRNHYLCDCEGYCNLRIQIFGRPTVPVEDLKTIPLAELVKFIYRSGRLDRKTQGDTIPEK